MKKKPDVIEGGKSISDIFSRIQNQEWAKRIALLLLRIEKDAIQRDIAEVTIAAIADLVDSNMEPKLRVIE